MLRPKSWKCQIAGMGHSDYVQYLQQLVSDLHLNDSISFLGSLSGDKKKNAFSEADAFVLPSFSESFGIAIAEAMSWGLPVVTTTATPWKVLSDQQMGWVVSPDLNALTFALFDLFNASDEQLSAMGQRARSYIRKHYDWSEISLKMLNCYDLLLKK